MTHARRQLGRGRRQRLGVAAAAFVFLLAGGCVSATEAGLRNKIAHLEEAVRDKDNQLAAQKTALEQVNQQLAVARGLSADDLTKIFYPEQLLIDRLTGGGNYDGQPGDDGVTVYIKPLDRDGDVIKVAGDLKIQLYDLAAAPESNLVGEYTIPADQIGKLWHGKLLTGHYTVKCPWPGRPPAHEELTVRAVFVDYLTKRVVSAQATCKAKLPPK